MATVNQKVPRGTTYSIGFQYKKGGVNHTLVGSTVRFTVKEDEYDQNVTDATAVIPIKNITTGDASGYARILITPSDTQLVEPGKYFYDIKVDEDSDGVNVYLMVNAKFELTGSPTNRLA